MIVETSWKIDYQCYRLVAKHYCKPNDTLYILTGYMHSPWDKTHYALWLEEFKLQMNAKLQQENLPALT